MTDYRHNPAHPSAASAPLWIVTVSADGAEVVTRGPYDGDYFSNRDVLPEYTGKVTEVGVKILTDAPERTLFREYNQPIPRMISLAKFERIVRSAEKGV